MSARLLAAAANRRRGARRARRAREAEPGLDERAGAQDAGAHAAAQTRSLGIGARLLAAAVNAPRGRRRARRAGEAEAGLDERAGAQGAGAHAAAATRSLEIGARLLAAGVTLGLGYWLKLSYSRAGADELLWVLAPSAWLARLGGVYDLVPEPGAGFISHSARMVVGPACAGVNFLLACWLALYLSVQTELRRPRIKQLLALSALCFGAAYLVTVSVNGLRIALAAQVFSLDLYGSGWTKARVHRLLGVFLYSAALLGTCLAAQRLQTRDPRQLPAARRLGLALCVYLGVSLGIPMLNRAFVRNPTHFAEHALLTLAGALSVLLLFLLAHRLCSRSE